MRTQRTDDELRQLALDIIEGRVFGTWNLQRPEDAPTRFMVMMFIDEETLERYKVEEVVHFYEYMDKAEKMSINGDPIFFSCHYLTRGEVSRLDPILEQARAMRAAFLGTRVRSDPEPEG